MRKQRSAGGARQAQARRPPESTVGADTRARAEGQAYDDAMRSLVPYCRLFSLIPYKTHAMEKAFYRSTKLDDVKPTCESKECLFPGSDFIPRIRFKGKVSGHEATFEATFEIHQVVERRTEEWDRLKPLSQAYLQFLQSHGRHEYCLTMKHDNGTEISGILETQYNKVEELMLEKRGDYVQIGKRYIYVNFSPPPGMFKAKKGDVCKGAYVTLGRINNEKEQSSFDELVNEVKDRLLIRDVKYSLPRTTPFGCNTGHIYINSSVCTLELLDEDSTPRDVLVFWGGRRVQEEKEKEKIVMLWSFDDRLGDHQVAYNSFTKKENKDVENYLRQQIDNLEFSHVAINDTTIETTILL